MVINGICSSLSDFSIAQVTEHRTLLTLPFLGAILWTLRAQASFGEMLSPWGLPSQETLACIQVGLLGMFPNLRGASLSLAHGNRIQGPPGLITQLYNLQKHAAPAEPVPRGNWLSPAAHGTLGYDSDNGFTALLIPVPPSLSPTLCYDSQKA